MGLLTPLTFFLAIGHVVELAAEDLRGGRPGDQPQGLLGNQAAAEPVVSHVNAFSNFADSERNVNLHIKQYSGPAEETKVQQPWRQ